MGRRLSDDYADGRLVIAFWPVCIAISLCGSAARDGLAGADDFRVDVYQISSRFDRSCLMLDGDRINRLCKLQGDMFIMCDLPVTYW